MEEYAKLIANYGVTIIIVALFIWDWITNRQDMKESLKEMAKTNENTSKSLDLLQKSMENQESIMQEHDKRSIESLSILHEINKKLE